MVSDVDYKHELLVFYFVKSMNSIGRLTNLWKQNTPNLQITYI